MISKVNNKIFFAALACVLILGSNSKALAAAPLTIEEEDLPAESVVPRLDSNMAVKNRLVPLDGRLEIGGSYGDIIDEMFYDSTLLGFQAFYHVTDDTAWGLRYLNRSTGLGTYGEQFTSQSGTDFSKSPAPGAIIAGIYRWSFLYGKMSFSKDLVFPTIFSLEGDVGINKIGTQNLPYTAIGVSHKLMMKRHFGLSLSYRWLLYQTINPVSSNIRPGSNPSESDFSKKLQISQTIDIGMSWLF